MAYTRKSLRDTCNHKCTCYVCIYLLGFNKMNTKKCPHCGLTKTIESFYRVKKTGRVYSWCKICDNERHQSLERRIKKHEYYLKNKEHKLAVSKLWIKNNRKKHNKYVRLYKLQRRYDQCTMLSA